jgi:hypothetical protein
LDEDSRRLIACAIAESIANKKPPISYSTSYDGGEYFDNGTLNYNRSCNGEGLTCATFVMAVFKALGFDLVQCDTWQEREDDKVWKRHIASCLEQWGRETGEDVTEHISVIRNNVDGIRFRPEEVAEGVIDLRAPLEFSDAQDTGKLILLEMSNG